VYKRRVAVSRTVGRMPAVRPPRPLGVGGSAWRPRCRVAQQRDRVDRARRAHVPLRTARGPRATASLKQIPPPLPAPLVACLGFVDPRRAWRLPGVAPVAMQQGVYAASVIADRVAGKQHTQPFHYRNKGNLATVGRSYGIADFGIFSLTGFIGWCFWLAVHIFFLIGFRNRFLVMFQWALAYLTFQRGARLITQGTSATQIDKQSSSTKEPSITYNNRERPKEPV